MSALTRIGALASCGAIFTISLTACAVKVNGKSYGPSSGSSTSSGSSGDGSRAERRGSSNELPPLHPVPGMRAMGRLEWGGDIYWFDIPKEAMVVDAGSRGRIQSCATIPTPGHRFHETVRWEPYGMHGERKKPVVPDLVGDPLATALKRLDELDSPLCVYVEWNAGCERDAGTVCKDQRAPDEYGNLVLEVAGREPRQPL